MSAVNLLGLVQLGQMDGNDSHGANCKTQICDWSLAKCVLSANIHLEN